MTSTLVRLLSAAVIAFLLAGCSGDGFDRQAVSGSVTYRGKPVVSGTVVFAPVPDTGPTHVAAVIENGRFAVVRDKGLSPGKYLVRFTANDRVVSAPSDPGAGTPEPPKQILPPRHNDRSTHEVEVRAGGQNVFEFRLD